jgi:hypothetical protein
MWRWPHRQDDEWDRLQVQNFLLSEKGFEVGPCGRRFSQPKVDQINVGSITTDYH